MRGRVYLAAPLQMDGDPSVMPLAFGSLTSAKRWCESFVGEQPFAWVNDGATWEMRVPDFTSPLYRITRRTVKP